MKNIWIQPLSKFKEGVLEFVILYKVLEYDIIRMFDCLVFKTFILWMNNQNADLWSLSLENHSLALPIKSFSLYSTYSSTMVSAILDYHLKSLELKELKRFLNIFQNLHPMGSDVHYPQTDRT